MGSRETHPGLRLQPRSGRWGIRRRFHHHDRPLWHRARPVQQRKRHGVGSHRGRCGTDPQPRAPGIGFVHRHVLGHGRHLRAHRTCARLKHPGLSRHHLRRWSRTHQSGLRQDSLRRRAIARFRHRHLCFLHHSRLVLLRGKSHGVPERETPDAGLSRRVHRQCLFRRCHAIGRRVELRRPDQCPDGPAQHRLAGLPLGRHSG